ncbi:MAG: exosome complex protein Rrp42 [Candidatus Heimdallarchaeota archaeon]|nr:exosome complex protein Rrp42 [Candidatus Heimdallarchaeota archaeon]
MSDFEQVALTIEKEYIKNLLASERRLDGRTKSEFREIKIETGIIGTAQGSSIVSIGKTKVICGVKAQIGTPYPDSPNKGSLTVGFEASPLSAPEHRSGPPQDHAIEIARVTDRLIRESECVDLESLCLIEGEKIRTLIIDIYSLDDFGNLIDACGIAALAALATTQLPDVQVENGEIITLDTLSPLKLKSFPISITSYKIGDFYINDADLREELISDARITFGTTETHIVSGQKGGQSGIKSNHILEILKDTIRASASIREEIKKQIPTLKIFTN